MKNNLINQLLDQYFEGQTSLKEEKQLRGYFRQKEIFKEHEPYAPLFRYSDKIAAAENQSAATEIDPFARLVTTQDEPRNTVHIGRSLTWILRIAAGFALLMTGFSAGLLLNSQNEKIDRLYSEMHHIQEVLMISLLDNPSATERLRAIGYSSDIPSDDSRVIEALMQTLNNDPNVNVRIAAVNALVGHSSNPAVREGLVRSISAQKSPIVQVALADAMLAMQERRSVNEFKKLLEHEEMDNNVRHKLENTILALS